MRRTRDRVRFDAARVWAFLLLIPVVGAAAQASVAAPQEFEVASVKLVNSLSIRVPAETVGIGRPIKPCVYSDRRVRCELTLGKYIAEAYGVAETDVVGPEWLKDDVFELNAMTPPGTTPSGARVMMQRMLADRFALKWRKEKRERNVYALVIDKRGARLKEAPHPEQARKRAVATPLGAIPSSTFRRPGHFFASSISMDRLAQNLTPDAGLLVVNMTGLSGFYTIDIRWTPETTPGMVPGSQGSDHGFLSEVQRQLGLRLEKRKIQAEMLVVDHANRKPVEN